MSGIDSRLCGIYLRSMELPATPPWEHHDLNFLYILTRMLYYTIHSVHRSHAFASIIAFSYLQDMLPKKICCRQAFIYPRLINEWKCFSGSLCCPCTFYVLVHSSVVFIFVYCWYITLSWCMLSLQKWVLELHNTVYLLVNICSFVTPRMAI